jgi:NitT/TauT family transport system substrate-binding protein
MKKILALFLILVLSIGCITPAKQETTHIRFGILPIEDALPIVVAKQEGFFSDEGISVEVVNFQSALERDSALTAGEIDGGINDPVGVLLLKNGGYDVVITSLCLGRDPSEGVFAILASQKSGINSIEELKGHQVAISSGTIIEFVTDTMLQEFGFKEGDVEKIEVKKIPIRLQMLLDGKVDAATLPEPLASLAVLKGAKILVSDAELPSGESISQTVIVFNRKFTKQNPSTVKAFFRAYKKAVEAINSNPDKYISQFYQIARVPEPLMGKYEMPKYPAPQPLPEKELKRAVDWMLAKDLLAARINYDDITDNRFLPS